MNERVGRPPLAPGLPPSLSSAWFPQGKGWRVLYKYTRRQYAEALVLRGEVRLGTLFGYRKVERFSPMIADPGEGITALTEEIVSADGPELSDFAAMNIPRSPGIYIANSTINLRVGSDNCWLFCTSARLSERVMKSMDPDYDACVEIAYPDLLRRIIANELIRQGRIRDHRRAGTVPCVYRVKSRPYTEDDGISPIVLKAPDYSEQDEVRMVFIPREPIPKAEEDLPLDLVCPALARCCRIVQSVPA